MRSEDNNMLRFRVEFKGKNFPKDLRRTMTFIAPDESRAKEWVAKQLAEWCLPTDTKFDVSPVKESEKKK